MTDNSQSNVPTVPTVYAFTEAAHYVCGNPLCRRKWKRLTPCTMCYFCPNCARLLQSGWESSNKEVFHNIVEFWYFILLDLSCCIESILSHNCNPYDSSIVLPILPLNEVNLSTLRSTFTHTDQKLVVSHDETSREKTEEIIYEIDAAFFKYFPSPPSRDSVKNWSSVGSRKRNDVSRLYRKIGHMERIAPLKQDNTFLSFLSRAFYSHEKFRSSLLCDDSVSHVCLLSYYDRVLGQKKNVCAIDWSGLAETGRRVKIMPLTNPCTIERSGPFCHLVKVLDYVLTNEKLPAETEEPIVDEVVTKPKLFYGNRRKKYSIDSSISFQSRHSPDLNISPSRRSSDSFVQYSANTLQQFMAAEHTIPYEPPSVPEHPAWIPDTPATPLHLHRHSGLPPLQPYSIDGSQNYCWMADPHLYQSPYNTVLDTSFASIVNHYEQNEEQWDQSNLQHASNLMVPIVLAPHQGVSPSTSLNSDGNYEPPQDQYYQSFVDREIHQAKQEASGVSQETNVSV